MRGVSAIIPAMRGALMGVFLAPGAALGALTKNLGMLALRLTGLPAIWSMITAAVSMLGTALSLLFSPIGLIVAAFVAAGVLIWRYWEPLKAFLLAYSPASWKDWPRYVTPSRSSAPSLTR